MKVFIRTQESEVFKANMSLLCDQWFTDFSSTRAEHLQAKI